MRKPAILVGKQHNFHVAYGIWKSARKQELKPKASKPKVLKFLSSKSLSLTNNKQPHEKHTDILDIRQPFDLATFCEILKQKRQNEKDHYEHLLPQSREVPTKIAEPNGQKLPDINAKKDKKIVENETKEEVDEKKLREIVKKYLGDPTNTVKPDQIQSDKPADRFYRIRSLPSAFREIQIVPVHTKPSFDWRRVRTAKQELKLQYSKYSEDEEQIARDFFRELPVLPFCCKKGNTQVAKRVKNNPYGYSINNDVKPCLDCKNEFYPGACKTNQLPGNNTQKRYTFKALDVDNYCGRSKDKLNNKTNTSYSNKVCKIRTNPAGFHYSYKPDNNQITRNKETKRYAFKAIDVDSISDDTRSNYHSTTTTPIMGGAECDKFPMISKQCHQDNWKKLVDGTACLEGTSNCLNNVLGTKCNVCPTENQYHRKIVLGDIFENRDTTNRNGQSRGKSQYKPYEYCQCDQANKVSPKYYVNKSKQRPQSRNTDYKNQYQRNTRAEQLLNARRGASTDEVVTCIKNYESTVDGLRSLETNSTRVNCDLGLKIRVDGSYDTNTTTNSDNTCDDCRQRQSIERPVSQNRYDCCKKAADTSTENNTSNGDSFVSAKSCLSQIGKDEIVDQRREKNIKTLSTIASITLESGEEEFFDCPTRLEDRTLRSQLPISGKSEKRCNDSQESMLEKEIKIKYIDEDTLGIQDSQTVILMKKDNSLHQRMSKRRSGSTNDKGKAHSRESRRADKSIQRVSFQKISSNDSRKNGDEIARVQSKTSCKDNNKGDNHTHGGKTDQGCLDNQNGQVMSQKTRKSHKSPGKLTMKIHCEEYLPPNISRSIKIQTNPNSIDAIRSCCSSNCEVKNGSKDRDQMCMKCKMSSCKCKTRSRTKKLRAMSEDTSNYQTVFQPPSRTDLSTTSEQTSCEKRPKCIRINRNKATTNTTSNPCGRPKRIKTNRRNSTRIKKECNRGGKRTEEKRTDCHKIDYRKDKAYKDDIPASDSDSWSDCRLDDRTDDQILCSTCQEEEDQQKKKSLELIKSMELNQKSTELNSKSNELNRKSKVLNQTSKELNQRNRNKTKRTAPKPRLKRECCTRQLSLISITTEVEVHVDGSKINLTNKQKPSQDDSKTHILRIKPSKKHKPGRKPNKTHKPGRIARETVKPCKWQRDKDPSEIRERDKTDHESSESRQSVYDGDNKRKRSESYRDKMKRQLSKIKQLSSCLHTKDTLLSDDSSLPHEKHRTETCVEVKAGNDEVFTISCSAMVAHRSVEHGKSSDDVR
ncbi:hypothetical protein WDU94_012009 [Cyamophila willieti]